MADTITSPTSSTIAITAFVGAYRFLSNFYPIADGLYYNGIVYPTAEHAYQAAKVNPYEEKLQIASVNTAGEAKRIGNTLSLRLDWEQVKVSIMYEILQAKFSDASLRERLLKTGDVALIEGNTWHDNIWGVCYCTQCISTVGKNILGKLLVKLRTELFLMENMSNDSLRALHTS